MKRIRVIHITRSLNVGGLEKLVASFAKKLDPQKYDVSVCCLLRKGFFAQEIEDKGIKVYLLGDDTYEQKGHFLFLKLMKLFKKIQPDIIHTHNTHAMIDGVLAGILSGLPVIIHTDHARRFPDKLRYMVVEKILSFFVHKIIAVSKRSKNDIVKHEKINPNKIIIIYNGIPEDRESYNINNFRKEIGLTDHYPILGYVGRLSAEKGPQYLIDALPEIIRKYPNSKLILVGDGVLRTTLEEQARSLHMSNHVLFCGYQRNIGPYMNIMDIFMLPSLREGMPLALLEAMSYGKAIVASNVGGVSEVITNGVTGHIVVPKDSRAITDAVLHILGTSGLLETMSAKTKKLFYEKFTENAMIRNYETLYLNELQGKNEKK